jgi:hypothetical protein
MAYENSVLKGKDEKCLCDLIIGIPPWGSVTAGRLDTISRIR